MADLPSATPALRPDIDADGAGLSAPERLLPEGVIAETTTIYRVGPYRYSKLEDALAEHGRANPELPD